MNVRLSVVYRHTQKIETVVPYNTTYMNTYIKVIKVYIEYILREDTNVPGEEGEESEGTSDHKVEWQR